jgi:hypothetical protein
VSIDSPSALLLLLIAEGSPMKLYTRTHVAILGIVLSLCALAAGVLVTALIIVPGTV